MTKSASSLTVTAVIPVHNGEDFVAEAIESVLGQSQPALECIVIDDGSTDATRDAVLQFGDAVTYIHRSQSGVAAARNHGTRLARAELVAFLDHDDVWLPTKLERQLQALSESGAAMALCAVYVIDSARTVLATKRVSPRNDLLTGMLLFDGTTTVSCSSTGLMRREALVAMGGFDTALSMSADWDLLLRMLLEGTVAYVDEPLVLYRVHESNMSRRVSAMERDMRYAFAKAFSNPALPESLRQRRNRAYGGLCRMLAGSYRDSGQLLSAARVLALGASHHPSLLLELARHTPAQRRSRLSFQ
jgi:glycosyltransferase involved in cell wall biosynthesis